MKRSVINLEWTPEKGEHQPFTEMSLGANRLRYRNKQVVKHEGKYYLVLNWDYDYHPNFLNQAKLKEVSEACLQYIDKRKNNIDEMGGWH